MKNSDSPNTVRQEFRQKRRELSVHQQQSAAQNILSRCIDSGVLTDAQTVACYLANDGEIDPHFIIEYCWQQQKRVVLPVLHPFCKGHLIFVEYHPETQMKTNRYGINEPIITSQTICPLPNIDLILTPLVAFDQDGNRLGMGGGYYDRTLAPIKRQPLSTHLVGLAHTCQQAPRLPCQSWDIPLDGIATPLEFIKIN